MKNLVILVVLAAVLMLSGCGGQFKNMDNFVKADATQALEMAKAHGDTAGAECYQAILDNSFDIDIVIPEDEKATGPLSVLEAARLTDPGLNGKLKTIQDKCASLKIHAQKRIFGFGIIR